MGLHLLIRLIFTCYSFRSPLLFVMQQPVSFFKFFVCLPFQLIRLFLPCQDPSNFVLQGLHCEGESSG